MPARTEFLRDVDRAASRMRDATDRIRDAGRQHPPAHQRRLLTSALRRLDAAQQDLFRAANDPWLDLPAAGRQMSLELL